jgi:endonuclease-3
VVPEDLLLHAHHWLILFGRYVCKARSPDCPACPVREFCAYKDKTAA